MIVLGARTDYSFMRGFGTPKQWLAQCEQQSVTALAVTDYCSTWGHAQFADAFKDSKTALLFGVQIPVVTVLEKDPRHDLVVLLAKSPAGLAAIYKLLGEAAAQSYYRSRVTWEQVRELDRSNSACVIATDLSLGSLKAAEQVKGLMIGARPVRDNMLRLVKEKTFPVVAMPLPMFPSTDDRETFSLMQQISGNQRHGELACDPLPLLRKTDYDSAMRAVGVEPSAEWSKLAGKIYKECVFPFPKASKIQMAKTPEEAMKMVVTRCLVGAKALKIDVKKEPYKSRLEREVSVIRDKQFADYFLFVADLVQWARGRMLVGPARGSSGGSLLCYLMGITTIDPIVHGTLFERFIDITRPDWPDIDVDFPDVRRDEVLAYLKEKHGAEHFARLGTISEFGGKSSVNDAAKAVGVPYEVARSLSGIIDSYIVAGQQRLSLAEIFQKNEDAKKYVEAYPQIEIAARLEDHARHHGVHAAGVVLSKEPITTFGSLDKNDTIALDMKMAEKIGLIKMDALGLRTLTVMQEVLDQTKITHDDLYNLDFRKPDPKVLKVFNEDRVTGIFQFEGHTTRQLMKQVTVETFDDLCAITSLARPGPLQGGAAAAWADRRMGKTEWDYHTPELAAHLKHTFGTITYQEQAMAIVRDLGQFDEPSVNGFRRAVGKKIPEQLRSYEKQFLLGCQHRGVSPEAATTIWDEMCEFGSYAFNYSHAVGYSMISYMAAYLKAYHPLEFAVAQLRNAADEDQAKQLLRELADEGYKYVPFDVDKSESSWSIQGGKLVGGFDSIRGVGRKTAETLLAARKAGGKKWLDRLTDSQRDRILSANNTPWHSLSYFGRTYADLYKNPSDYRGENVPKGIVPPVYRIKDIPAQENVYRFLGRIIRKMSKDANEAARVAKRGGEKVKGDTTFFNLIIADDTGEIGCTINRFKVKDFQWLLESNHENRDFLFKGKIIGEDRRWVFIDNILEIFPQEGTNATDTDQVDTGGNRKPERAGGKANRRATVHRDGHAAGGSPDAGTGRGKSGRVARTRRKVRG